MKPSTVFKIATEPDEFEQVHRLNYRTFVEEIPQHTPNPSGRLVDKFHAENTYFIGVRDHRVIAMLAVRRRRPFSLDGKLPDLDRWLPAGRHLVEFRLLSVEPAHRNGPVPAALMLFAARHCRERGDDLAIISGALRRLPLYRALGFEAFGPIVGTAEASFQPMFLTLEKYLHAIETRRSLHLNDHTERRPVCPPVNLLPGPVTVSPAVLAAVGRTPLSHRTPEFVAMLADVRRRLAALTKANGVQVLPGSGSLANDVIAAQLAGLHRPGIVVSTGEFGERLAEHAHRAGLDFHWARLPWGTPLTADNLREAAGNAPSAAWLWVVHHETSTGVLHDLVQLKEFARQHRMALSLDCISSVGAVDVDLRDVYLASGVSGKGFAALPGLALVFHQTEPAPRPDLPRYLDLGLWAAAASVPFTHSSNLVAALDVALAEVERLPAGRCGDGTPAAWLRAALREAGFELAAQEHNASPIIVTVKLPPTMSASDIGAGLERSGYISSHRSGYLIQHNWIQFCMMGSPSLESLAALVEKLRAWHAQAHVAVPAMA